MEELGIKMRFKRCVKAMVVFAIFVIFGWDIINFLGSRYTIGMFDLSVVYLCHRISPEFYFLIYLRFFMGSNPQLNRFHLFVHSSIQYNMFVLDIQ